MKPGAVLEAHLERTDVRHDLRDAVGKHDLALAELLQLQTIADLLRDADVDACRSRRAHRPAARASARARCAEAIAASPYRRNPRSRTRSAVSTRLRPAAGLRSAKAALVPVRVGRRARALAASSFATCSGVSFQPTAPRFCRSCSSLRAPMITRRHGRPLQQPVERDLRHGLAGLLARPRRARRPPGTGTRRAPAGPCRPRAGSAAGSSSRQRLAAADLAGEPAPAERAPDDRADLLVERERHQLPLVVAADERVVRLVRDVARRGRSARRRRATSSGASRRSSSSRCSGSCRRAPGRRACRAPPRPASCASKPCSW